MELLNPHPDTHVTDEVGDDAKALAVFNASYKCQVMDGKGDLYIERPGGTTPPVWKKGRHYKIKATVGNERVSFPGTVESWRLAI
jgi:hypothetical protein